MIGSPKRHRLTYTKGASSPLNISHTAADLVAETAFHFEETMRDEEVLQLRQQLDEERKKHREMKEMFDETLHKMEQQKA